MRPQGSSTPSDLETLRRRATQPSGPDGVKAVVGRRLALYPQTEMNPGEWGAWWADYFEALEDIPTVAVEAGMAAWVRRPESQFMPKPGQLRELAMNTPNDADRAYNEALRQLEAPVVNKGAQAWDWPTQAEYDAMPLPEQIRQNRIMAGRCRSDAGPQGMDTMPDDMPDAWKAYRVKAKHYDDEAKRLTAIYKRV